MLNVPNPTNWILSPATVSYTHLAMAEAYAKAGAKIAFNCRSQHHMDQALAEYKAKGIEAKGYICDVTDEEPVSYTHLNSGLVGA